MSDIKYKICVVCYANYCRSPVAEFFLKTKLSSVQITSAGINPMYSSTGMDPRSKNFIESKGLKPSYHLPKKINTKIIHESDLVLAMDHEILMILNKNFKKYKSKFKLFNYLEKKLHITDPFKFDVKKYNEIMQKIYIISRKYEYEALL